MKKLEMWSEFIFLVLIIYYKAEASIIPYSSCSSSSWGYSHINPACRRQAPAFDYADYDYYDFLDIHLGEDFENKEKFTAWKGQSLTIGIKYRTARYAWCTSYYVNNETGDFSHLVPITTLGNSRSYSTLDIKKVTAEMNTMWNCTVLTNHGGGKPYEYNGHNYTVRAFYFQVHVKGAEPRLQTILVNNMVVPAVVDYGTMDVDFTAEYHYVDGDTVNVTCVNLSNEDNATLTMEYEMAGTKSDKSTVEDISSSKMIGFVTKLYAGHNNSYMICTNTGTTAYAKMMIRFVMLTKPNIISISINGMSLRPRLISGDNGQYEIKYKFLSNQVIYVTCEIERTDVKLFMMDDDFGKTLRTKTELTPRKTVLSVYQNPRDNTSLGCVADYVTGGLKESVLIEFTAANLPIDIVSQVLMELPPSGTVMELYSYKDYKLSVILYELKQNETLHLTCGPLLSRREPAPELYLQLNNTEICKTDGCNVSTTLQNVSREHVHPPIVCSLKETHDPGLPSTTKDIVRQEIRVIFVERALAVTDPSSTTLSTTLTTNNTTAEPPTSKTVIDSNNNKECYCLPFWLIALGVAMVIIILIKKQCCVRLCLPIPATRLDPTSVFYVNLLSACRPINEREAAALPENIYEEIRLGDLTNKNSNRNKFDSQYDDLLNGEMHQYTEIDYARCSEVTKAPHENNYIYDEPYEYGSS